MTISVSTESDAPCYRYVARCDGVNELGVLVLSKSLEGDLIVEKIKIPDAFNQMGVDVALMEAVISDARRTQVSVLFAEADMRKIANKVSGWTGLVSFTPQRLPYKQEN